MVKFKKLIILLLLFGFSYGQDILPQLIGTWKTVSVEQSYIFIKDGTGYWSFTDSDGKDYNSKFSWMVVNTQSKDGTILGTIIMELEDVDLKIINTLVYIKKEEVDEGLVKYYFTDDGLKWNEEDFLIWWDIKQKSPTPYTLLERSF